jgi:hypothetical protein
MKIAFEVRALDTPDQIMREFMAQAEMAITHAAELKDEVQAAMKESQSSNSRRKGVPLTPEQRARRAATRAANVKAGIAEVYS